jgi:cyclin T
MAQQHPQPPSTNGNSTATADSSDPTSSRESWWDQTMTRWYVSRVEILNSPSIRLHGLDHETELSKRQTCASLIQEMATRLKVQQLVTNTAIIYMHRFYLIHSFHNFEAHWVAPACLFLAAKVEEQPRRLEHVIREAHMLLAPTQPLDARGTHSRVCYFYMLGS